MEGGAVGHTIEKGLPMYHPSQIYFNLVQRFQRRRFKCDLLSKYVQFHYLYNQYKSVERKISQKNPEYILIYSLSVAAVKF